MYYWSMLQKNESELAKQVFQAQKEFPSKKSDCVKQVYEDLEFYEWLEEDGLQS